MISDIIEADEDDVPETLEIQFNHCAAEIEKKSKLIIEAEELLKQTPEQIELQTLGEGKAFGEKALITDQPRAATIECVANCHLAVMSKHDYDKVLRKFELKQQNKMVEFLKTIPYLKHWSYKLLINFSYFLQIRTYPIGHIIYKEGDPCNEIAIIKNGIFEMRKKLPQLVDKS